MELKGDCPVSCSAVRADPEMISVVTMKSPAPMKTPACATEPTVAAPMPYSAPRFVPRELQSQL